MLFCPLRFSVAEGLPEPGLVMYGTFVNTFGGANARLTSGRLIWTIQPAAGGAAITLTGGQFLLGDLEKEGKLEVGQVLRLRVRFFTDGVVLGSRNYVNEVFAAHRDRFGPKRKTGARRMRGLTALGDLATLRDPRVNVVG